MKTQSIELLEAAEAELLPELTAEELRALRDAGEPGNTPVQPLTIWSPSKILAWQEPPGMNLLGPWLA